MDSKADHNVCPLCSATMMNYGVGKCNHVVCGKCAIRMRVICHSKECPVCRQHLDRVFVTKSPMKFDELDQTKQILNDEFDLLFESKILQKYYEDLMTCKCKVCGDVSRSMSALNRHYNNAHQLMICDLCMNNLKHFPVEFPVYTGAELVAHRKWTPDAPGRGHPLCKFCERRYYDADEWYRHLRRDHFMCHVCEREAADTTTKRTVFGDYESLLEHCRTVHYVCEEGECAQQTFTNMFASEAELKAHRLSYHSLTKAEVRETRRLDVEIRFTADTTAEPSIHRERGGPPNAGRGGGGGAGRGFRKNREPPPEASGLGLEMRNLPGMATALEISQAVDAQSAARANGEVPYQENPQDFPTLRGHAPKFNRPNAFGPRAASATAAAAANGEQTDSQEEEEEADLWSGPRGPNAKPATGGKDGAARSSAPAAPVPAAAAESRNWQHVMNPSSLTADDFPALAKPAGRASGAGGVWRKPVSGGQQRPTASVPSRARASAAATDINSPDSFPCLGRDVKRPAAATASSLPWKPSVPAPSRAKPTTRAVPDLSADNFPSLGGGGAPAGPRNTPWESIVKAPGSAKKPTPAAVPAAAQKKTAKSANQPQPQSKRDAATPQQARDPIEDSVYTPSYAEEKTGRRMNAEQAYESVGTQEGKQGKIQMIREMPSAVPPPAAGNRVFRMDDEDFPAMGRSGGDAGAELQWGPKIAQADLYIDVPEEPSRSDFPAKLQVLAPNVGSAADFPSLGMPKQQGDPTAMTNRGHVRENKKGKKGKKGRQTRQAEVKEENFEEETPRQGPIEAPFSLGDLAASLLNVQYQEVPEMDERNRILFESLAEMLGSRFSNFVQSSTRYRNREISARSYIDAVSELVSKSELASFMPEMLVLLPDIGLQKSLMTVLQPESRRHLRECSTCGQIVTSADLPFHMSVHC